MDINAINQQKDQPTVQRDNKVDFIVKNFQTQKERQMKKVIQEFNKNYAEGVKKFDPKYLQNEIMIKQREIDIKIKNKQPINNLVQDQAKVIKYLENCQKDNRFSK